MHLAFPPRVPRAHLVAPAVLPGRNPVLPAGWVDVEHGDLVSLERPADRGIDRPLIDFPPAGSRGCLFDEFKVCSTGLDADNDESGGVIGPRPIEAHHDGFTVGG